VAFNFTDPIWFLNASPERARSIMRNQSRIGTIIKNIRDIL
jgi:hypothetical protein